VTGKIVASEHVASQVAAGETVAAAIQLAIGLLTASLDSPELEARALAAFLDFGLVKHFSVAELEPLT
jgi:hypothetical protein